MLISVCMSARSSALSRGRIRNYNRNVAIAASLSAGLLVGVICDFALTFYFTCWVGEKLQLVVKKPTSIKSMIPKVLNYTKSRAR